MPGRAPCFRCVFTKNDRLDGKLTGNQVIDTRYRQEPLSIHHFDDQAERTLLEYYLITDLRLKPPLTDRDFVW